MDREEARESAQAIVMEVYNQGHLHMGHCQHKIYDEYTMDWCEFWADDEIKELEASIYIILRGDGDAD